MATKAKAKKATKPAAKKVAPAPAASTDEVFGVSSIAEILKVKTGKEVKTRDLRVLLRKMARDGRLDREIVAGNRERWTWEGPDDPEVALIVEAFEAGELEADKKAKLDALKARKAEQRAAKKAEEESEEDDDEELEEEDDDSDEE